MMDQIRKLHNSCKKELINANVSPGSRVLDCGCGRGGDWWKWKAVGAHVFAIDPDAESIAEAEIRAREANLPVFFLGLGDIRQAAFAGPFDVVCYNFSLHYIVNSWEDSIKGIGCAVRPGGLLIGVVPDKNRAISMADEFGEFFDRLGNNFKIWRGGRRLLIGLADGPFYAEGPKDEPLLDPETLIESLKGVGIELVSWEPMIPEPNGLISDLYSKFVFKKL